MSALDEEDARRMVRELNEAAVGWRGSYLEQFGLTGLEASILSSRVGVETVKRWAADIREHAGELYSIAEALEDGLLNGVVDPSNDPLKGLADLGDLPLTDDADER